MCFDSREPLVETGLAKHGFPPCGCGFCNFPQPATRREAMSLLKKPPLMRRGVPPQLFRRAAPRPSKSLRLSHKSRCGVLRRRAGGAAGGGGRWQRRGEKVALYFLLWCRCCQALVNIFSSIALGALSHGLDESGGFLSRWGISSPTTLSPCGRKRPAPVLCASFDESRKHSGRRPHLSDGLFHMLGRTPGRLHQHQG
jgi:hypothetical protein